MSDMKRQVSKMLAEEIVHAIKKLTDDNNKQYVNNQIKNYGSTIGGNGGSFSQAIIDAIGSENFQNDVSAAIVDAIIGNFEKLIANTAVVDELYGSYANFINLVATNGQFENVDVDKVWADIAIISAARIEYLDVDKLVLRTSDGTRVELIVNENGELTTRILDDGEEPPKIPGGFVSGDILGDQTISASKLRVEEIDASHIKAETFAELDLSKNNSVISLIDGRISLIVKDTDGDGTYSNIILTEEMITAIANAIRFNAKEEFSIAVNDIAEDIDAFSKMSATANKIYWLIADGDDASAFTLTPEVMELISKNIKLTTEQLDIVAKDLDMTKNESLNSLIRDEADSKSTIHRSETPPINANKNDIWIQPSTGYIHQLVSNEDVAFYLDEDGVLYVDSDSYFVDGNGDLYSLPEDAFTLSDDGLVMCWQRVKDADLSAAELKLTPDSIVGVVTGSQPWEEMENTADEMDNKLVQWQSEFTQRMDGFELSVERMVDGDELRTYLRYQDGRVEIGRSDSRYTTETSDAGFVVLQDGVEMTSMVKNTMAAPVIEAKRQFQIGNFVIRAGADGGLLIL